VSKHTTTLEECQKVLKCLADETELDLILENVFGGRFQVRHDQGTCVLSPAMPLSELHTWMIAFQAGYALGYRGRMP
jgi:hypothetical protein